ncbi:MAG: GNAT family N-acetyltransferase [Pseudomonadota bacterium]
MNVAISSQQLPQLALTESDTAGLQRGDVRTTIIPADQWDQLALRFVDVVHEQTQCFNGGRWSEDQIERLAFWQDDELAAAAVLRKMSVPGTGVRITVLRWGPLWRPTGRPVRVETLAEVYDSLAQRYAADSRDFLLLMSRTDPAANDDAPNALSARGYEPLVGPGSKPRYFVDVSLDPDTLRASLAQKWRYNLKKSEKNGLEIEILEGEAAFQRFRAMHQAMVQRKGIHETGPIDTLADILAAPQDELRPLVFIVSHQGEAVAGAVVDTSGEQANYLYGATTDRALPLKAGYFMQWKIVEHLSALPQSQWYGLGGGSSATCSLHQFKRGLVGKAGLTIDEPDAFYRAGSTYAALIGVAVTRVRWWQVTAHNEIQKRISSLRYG